ncbi:SCO-spondin-like isoform X2 [Dreissena polymorpha]|uniref:SCO-spondin-like isoform X2 n=1 Tax=Dreissena polymorpha TaxID=45954 RepID=UPI0022648BA1|nr:SCO-spondin-like isoform X2 [Dreissena polymorpha]
MDFSHVFVLIFCVLGVRGSDFCYSCMGMTNRNECQQIKECQQNQYCLLQRVSDGISVTYNIGCSDQTVCPASNKGEILIIGRSVSSDNSDCTSCCHDDLCIPNDCSLIMDTTTVETAVTATVTTAATTPFAKTSTTSVVETGSAWSDWSPWTPCPYTCGHDGIQHRFRHCTVTAFGCEGPKFESKICHSRVCCTGPPFITYIDHDKQIPVGGFLSLYCNATNADQILWQIPKVVGKPYPINVFRPVGLDTVVISNAFADNRGAYVCTARNACGEDQSSLMVDVI